MGTTSRPRFSTARSKRSSSVSNCDEEGVDEEEEERGPAGEDEEEDEDEEVADSSLSLLSSSIVSICRKSFALTVIISLVWMSYTLTVSSRCWSVSQVANTPLTSGAPSD